MSKIEIRNIGKKEALDILSRNENNRKITRANVEFLKQEMINERFLINGSTIVISEDGTLLDGQHRLMAISEVDMNFDLIFVNDAKKEVFTTIDTGKNRCASDIMSIRGVKNHNNVSATTRKIMDEFRTKRKLCRSGTVKLSNTEIYEYFSKNREYIEECVDFCMKLYMGEIKVATVSTAAAMMYLFSRQNKFKAKSFIRELFNGTKEGETNAAQTLRKRLLNYRIDHTRLSEELERALFIVSFNAYRGGRDISKIQINKNMKEYIFKGGE